MAAPSRTTTFANPPDYTFNSDRLRLTLHSSTKQPIVLVACGSFNPITYHHLRMFEMASDFVRQNTDFEIIGGYLSPVSDEYKKPGLVSAHHRVEMCTLATKQESTWLMVDSWEAFLNYQRTAVVLDHFNYEINTVLGGVYTQDGEHRDVRIMLLAGSDLISTMSEPGVWSHNDLDHILGRYGTFVIERSGSGMDQATDSLARWRNNIYPIPQLIQNDVSSTKVRLFFRRGLSVQYLLPAAVITYIEQNNLYPDDGLAPEKDKGKAKDRESGEADTGSESSSSIFRQAPLGPKWH
ncbi:Nucleotidylyl transferase [Rhizopogon vinicolor AM-OR11-026]|uniref:Nicotinamide-nucleotide adenylyltransferase n=1 Tax=Rhizopogon vinicolor AM-OR11-026 TaxID=1314800 RepID=A0A1B7NDS7_9AGAM|nr:Nucleotidylyl transferase [Rhizopogon vinicolor AM-OR11-026]